MPAISSQGQGVWKIPKVTGALSIPHCKICKQGLSFSPSQRSGYRCRNQRERGWCERGSVGWPGVSLFSGWSGAPSIGECERIRPPVREALLGRNPASARSRRRRCSRSQPRFSLLAKAPGGRLCREAQQIAVGLDQKELFVFSAFLRRASAAAGFPGLGEEVPVPRGRAGHPAARPPGLSGAHLGGSAGSRVLPGLAPRRRGEERAAYEHRALEIARLISGGQFILGAGGGLRPADKSVNREVCVEVPASHH